MSYVELKREIDKIKERNRRVEADKAWETSWTRRLFVAISTYILIVLLLVVVKVERPWETALIPTVAYVVSTLTLGILKNWWLERKR